MQVTYDLGSTAGVAIGVARGELSLEDMAAAAMEMWRRVEGPRIRILWDLRDARFDLTPGQVQKLAAFVKSDSPRGDMRTAFVLAGDLEFGLVRMFEVLRETPQARARAFRDMTAALEWLTAGAEDPA